MRDGLRRSYNAHEAEKAAKDKERRIGEIAAICDAARRGGIAIDRALAEIIDTARGDAAAVVRVGEQGHTPEVRT
jgi:hypothetical protein